MAKNEKPVLGMINCPHCGEVEGMAVKHDKNDEPFGHCEECSGQLRVGGKPGRVRKFCRMHPWAAAGAAPVTAPAVEAAPVTAPAVEAAPVTEKPAGKIPVTVTVTEPKKAEPKREGASWLDAISSLNKAMGVAA